MSPDGAGDGVPAHAPPASRQGLDLERPATYVSMGRYFLNRRLSPARVWRLLWHQQTDFLGSEGKSGRRAALMDLAPEPVARTWRASRGAWRFLLARRRGGSGGRQLSLPVDGEIALERRSGAVKVLQHDEGRVVTIMQGPAFRRKLDQRFGLAQRVAAYPFAPAIKGAALDAGWFSEEFVQGQHPTGFRGCQNGFDRIYLPLLIAFLRAEPPAWTTVGAYAAELADDITAPQGLLRRLPAASQAKVVGFVADMRERLVQGEMAQQPAPLVLSHGDYFSGNLVMPQGGGPPRAIDWAHVGRRTPLHDLHFVVVNHCFRVVSEASRTERLAEAIDHLRSGLRAVDPSRFGELEPGLTVADVWRWLFYLECIQTPLMSCDDPDDRYIAAMLTRVGWFEAYEQPRRPVR